MSDGKYHDNMAEMFEQAILGEVRRLSNMTFRSIFEPVTQPSEFRRAALVRLMAKHGFVPHTEAHVDA